MTDILMIGLIIVMACMMAGLASWASKVISEGGDQR
ncbi:MAG: signal peptide protein [Paenibacillaceae bacterium]|uniref:Signal peptide protein n=1 Tax=Paenibacillus mellifer TaxID=2937794 RepID=A0A9X1Y1B9_9BACL|nr:hypothetical protein [Paenibacillus mellifer]MBW4840398.1 signal peptide protein [Paenibacillaceae bacterium]MCK8487568.1 signal peptide protein [Paenibacillus mellifer]